MKVIDINNKERDCLKVYFDPKWPGYATVNFASKSRPDTTRQEWYPLADFLIKNPELKHLFTNAPEKSAEEVSGTGTATGDNYLVDEKVNWQENIYAGYNLWISRGPGEGQTRVILSNTNNKLIIDKPWDTPPNHLSQYTIVQNLTITPKAVGNTLPLAELQEFEEKARKMKSDLGLEPPPRQYTKD
ncbi:hypothetical protein A2572_03835 [Candidatus Collierbacteria bacterium RIFOXYD1_FULL_40_9]|uniref:Uncharacterized protein n=1 Tax=Candidatus Collierbacteria bacterium RIFOXYD1_FULL_40_9 TaxID=1817731 RepID=A0A1F5FU68_9BACT|nr:MAG: hypothetical protein A2572_03835 [Candidatus Collierbacteria bacterium RIFOXYD1_FULL_40_9]